MEIFLVKFVGLFNCLVEKDIHLNILNEGMKKGINWVGDQNTSRKSEHGAIYSRLNRSHPSLVKLLGHTHGLSKSCIVAFSTEYYDSRNKGLCRLESKM